MKKTYKEIARIRRPHGLDGAVVAQVVTDTFYDAHEILKGNTTVMIEDVEYEVERLFGIVKDVFRIKLVGQTVDTAKELAGKWIAAEYKGFDYDRLVSLPIKQNDKTLAKITGIYDFGAGIVVDTNKDMYSILQLDLRDVGKGVVYLK